MMNQMKISCLSDEALYFILFEHQQLVQRVIRGNKPPNIML